MIGKDLCAPPGHRPGRPAQSGRERIWERQGGWTATSEQFSACPALTYPGPIASSSLPPRRQNRANWVALRTLRQVPKLVGKTDGGDPLFEVRNVRMVLRGEANHFSRLVTCTNCGREVPGLPILSPDDLTHAPGPFVCTDCVEALRTQGAPPPSPAPPAEDAELRRLAGRIDELEGRLGEDAGALDALEQRLAAAASAAHAEAVTLRLAVDERLDALDDTSEAQRQDLQAALRDAMADVRAVATVPADITDRLHALEQRATRAGAEVAELGELHAALDAGLGTLRSEIADVRSAVKRVADGQADLGDRLETYVRASLAPDEQAKGRRSGRKGTDADRITTAAAAIEDLLREQRQLKEQVAALAQASDTASAAASRAASQVSALSPLRSEIKLLHQELAEQNETLEALRKAVERPAAKKAPAEKAPAAKRAPRAKKQA